jgi:hypothetical protein
VTAPTSAPAGAGSTRRRWSLGALLGVASGLAPHLLHHAGLLAGTALLAGIGGTALFGVIGLAAMAPMLLKLRRRFANWWAPGIAVAVFAAMFAVSAFLVGPALRSGGDHPTDPGPVPSAPASDHQHTRRHG